MFGIRFPTPLKGSGSATYYPMGKLKRYSTALNCVLTLASASDDLVGLPETLGCHTLIRMRSLYIDIWRSTFRVTCGTTFNCSHQQMNRHGISRKFG